MGILAADTHPDAERVQLAILSRLSSEQKARILTGAVRAGFRVSPSKPDAAVDIFAITAEVVEVLNELAVPYFIGGSVASTFYGEPRFTQDVDVIVQLQRAHVVPLARRVEKCFYVSEHALVEAIERRSCANLIHFATSFKIDLMISRERPFEASRFARRRRLETDAGAFWVASPEDTVLAKLEWYRMGNEVSERQWRDVLSVLLTQPNLDLAYLKTWASELGIADLIARALQQVSQR